MSKSKWRAGGVKQFGDSSCEGFSTGVCALHAGKVTSLRLSHLIGMSNTQCCIFFFQLSAFDACSLWWGHVCSGDALNFKSKPFAAAHDGRTALW